MFHNERYNHPDLKKSSILNFIAFLQAMWFAFALFIIPLYLFEIFQSGEVIWLINSIAGWIWIIITLLLSILLWKLSRWVIFKISIFIIFSSIITFLITSKFTDAAIARSLLVMWWTIISSVLSLYVKDLSEKEELWKNQWFFQVSKNIAWLIWPISAWYLFEFVKNNKEIFAFLWDKKYIEYNLILYIALFFILSTFFVFLWAKFVNKHPHLQIKPHSKEINKHHHYKNFKFILEYFKNKYRTFSFLNIMFLSLWFSTFYGFWFLLFLKNWWISGEQIWLFMWLIWLPLVVFEWFMNKIIKFIWWSINSLILWYTIAIFFLILWIFFWQENIYIFIWFFILAHIWISLAEPLQDFQYFEWIKKWDEAKFYSIHMIWWWIIRLIMPFLFWLMIANFWTEKAFYSWVWFLWIFLIILIWYKIFWNKK